MSKCPGCPIVDGPCAGEAGRWAGIACRLAGSGREADRRWILLQSGQAPPPPPAPEPAATVPLAKALEVLACPHRTREPACGCAAMGRCTRLAKDVSMGDCLGCLARGKAEFGD